MANNGIIDSFARIELKYRVPASKYEALLQKLSDYVEPDEYGETKIFNIYYDTPDYRLIRRSISKPVYKEKLRLRTYRMPKDTTGAFIEIKKKYAGVVYKRRITLPYSIAKWHLDYKIPFREMENRYLDDKSFFTDAQIEKEINSMIDNYKTLIPAMVIIYDRTAYRGIEDPDFRITFDRDIKWRDTDLDISKGAYGTNLLKKGERLMEIKIAGAMPIEIARILSELKIYKSSYSKYGSGYLQLLEREKYEKGIRKYV